MASSTSAKGPATGYLYQAYYSLLALLEADPGASVFLEKLEDVDLHDGEDQQKLLQLKHKLIPGGMISESSVDFLKTLSNWSQRIEDNDVDLDSTVFKLLTTQTIKPDSVPFFLTSNNRDLDTAFEKMKIFLKEVPGITVAPYVERLKKLDSDELHTLLSVSEVVGEQPHINEIEISLDRIFGILVPPRYLNEVKTSLIGVWITAVKEQLTTVNSPPIQQEWIHTLARYYASFYQDDSLPIYLDINPNEADIKSLDERRFVSQLKKLGINVSRLQTYKEDYFRAFHHISKWSRDNLVSVQLMDSYYRKLEREWHEVLHTLVDDLPLDNEQERTIFGKKLLNRLMLERIPNIKRKLDEPFIGRGCYHMLADEENRLFWHPDFEERLLERYLEKDLRLVI